MKRFLVLVTCLALTSVAYADAPKKGKGKHSQDEAQGAPQVNKSAKIKGGGQSNRPYFRPFNNATRGQASRQSNLSTGPGGGPHMKSKIVSNAAGKSSKFSKHGDSQVQANSNVPAIQKGGKFQGKHQFKQFNLAKNKAPSNVPNVHFKAGNQIQGAHKWKGQKYVVFQNYKAQWHDQGWWHHHHNHIVFVLGGWYFWDGGYYYPAWGYAPDSYYAFDGPIYTGSAERDPGDVVANVQAALQEQGYYEGEVDGALGPLTRAALARYQESQGFEPTGAIDEPTLESLNMV
jgi:hypothetical protein